MAEWIECRSYAVPGTTVWVNLDNIAKISGGKVSSTLMTVAGQEIVVENLAHSILAGAKVRLVA